MSNRPAMSCVLVLLLAASTADVLAAAPPARATPNEREFTPQARAAVNRALAWLAQQQEEDFQGHLGFICLDCFIIVCLWFALSGACNKVHDAMDYTEGYDDGNHIADTNILHDISLSSRRHLN